ncbi:MAG: dihydroorotase [Bauldia sp.]|nr:dihydroorotase [Bauldia sp.]
MTDTITIRAPDDWHVHLRDGAMLNAVLPFTARRFARAIVMPNLVPPVATTADADAYRARILAALPEDADFTPLMTAYLRDDTDADDIANGFRDGVLTAVKLYPAHATTNAAAGVTDIARVRPVLARMETIGMPLLIHGEDAGPEVDIFEREQVFVERRLAPLLHDFPGLKVVLEHLSTAIAVDFVRAHAPQLAGTITPHHLVETRNSMLGHGLRPHLYCMPVVKRESDRVALVAAATSGEACFFLGTDTAPHALGRKLAPVCAAGVFNAPVAIETYAEVFDKAGRLDRLEAFASLNGPRHYGLPVNERTITLVRAGWTAPREATVEGPEGRVAAYRGGETIAWQVSGAA